MEVATSKCFIERSVQFEEDHLCDPPTSEAQEGITTLPLPFDDDYLSHVLDSDEEEPKQHDLGIEAEPHDIIDPDLAFIPLNQRTNPRLSQNLIDATVDGAGTP